MKQGLFRSFVVLVVLLTLFSISVVPASAKGIATITFQGLHFIGHKGYVFKFSVTGELKAKNMPAFIRIGKHSYDLNCRADDSADLVCSPTDSLRHYVGRSVQGAVGGFSFSTVVPKPVYVVRKYCYGVFDYDQSNVWSQIGTYCRSNSATVGSTIDFYNPDYEDTFTYYFYENGSSTVCDYGAPEWGPGYYYDYPSDC